MKYLNYDIVFQEIPNETILAINITNCPNRCEGCHSPILREDIGEVLTKEEMSKLLLRYGNQITCVCIMGGDSDISDIIEIASFVKSWNEKKIKLGWYSGASMLPEKFPLQNFDYIKLGDYRKKLGGLRSKNTNQRLYKINDSEKMIDITDLFWK